MEMYYKKDGHYREQACVVDIGITVSSQEHIFRIGKLDIWQTMGKICDKNII